ncbi:MAG: hypothetical protein RBT45_08540 [Acholeplasmataceae bacterium]|jgi:hypothetical protein|nr:hypothetical protein [Acholeplasmataceae bacterium]
MRYLAISKTPFYVAYAVFHNEALQYWGKVNITQDRDTKRIKEWKRIIEQLVEEHKPQFLLTHLLDKTTLMKKEIERIVEIRTILKLVCEEQNVMYCEFKTDGWELRITNGKATDIKKMKVMAQGYNIKIDDVEVANAIILGEGVAWGRLHIGG